MRVWGQRYNRDLQRYNLALRMIAHEARTHTICDWTGLPDDRIRHLYQSYVHDQKRLIRRRRGPSPQSLAFFFESARSRSEAAALVGLCYMLGVLPFEVVSNPRRDLPGVGRGQRLCDAYEMYLSLVPETPITLEHVVLLIMTVSEGREFEVTLCDVCGGVVVQDRGSLRHRNCAHCNEGVLRPFRAP